MSKILEICVVFPLEIPLSHLENFRWDRILLIFKVILSAGNHTLQNEASRNRYITFIYKRLFVLPNIFFLLRNGQ